jgi:glycine reductase
VDLDSLREAAAAEPAIAGVELELVRPGDPARIANVLDAVEPSVKADDPETTFPGALGRLAPAGRGRSNRLSGVTVIPVCDLNYTVYADEAGFGDAFVDMAGPGADRSEWGSTTNVVLSLTPRDDVEAADADRAFRRCALRVARDLAATTIGAEPSRVEEFGPVDRSGGDAPAVAVILQVASEGPLLDTFYYGQPMAGMCPTLADPREVLDGAITNGAYEWASARNPTACYQRSALIRELFAADGVRLRFVGVILALGYLNSAFEKQRSAMLSAQLAGRLGADGVVCTTFETGNSHTDTMLTVRACESLGIRTCALVTETNGGLTDHVPEADCLVSTGNEDELVPAWSPERVIGAVEARTGVPVPVWAYLGSTGQMGDMRWTAVSE